jgi:hypothetical protein
VENRAINLSGKGKNYRPRNFVGRPPLHIIKVEAIVIFLRVISDVCSLGYYNNAYVVAVIVIVIIKQCHLGIINFSFFVRNIINNLLGSNTRCHFEGGR